jgi:hypothetical protein
VVGPGLRDAIYDDFREFSAEPFRIFFDTSEIQSHSDWQLRLRQGLVTSRVLLVMPVTELSAQPPLPVGVGGIRASPGSPTRGRGPGHRGVLQLLYLMR